MSITQVAGRDFDLHGSKRGDYVLYQGKAVSPGDLGVLLAVTKYAVGKPLNISQGGLGSVSASAGTHDWLHVYDVSINGWTKDEVWDWCRAATYSGCRPFPRGFVRDTFQGGSLGNIHDGNEHVHVLVGVDYYPKGHPARYQQLEYDARGDGLVGSAPYTGPWRRVSPWAESPYNPLNRTDVDRTYEVVTKGSLLGLDVDRKPVISQANGAKVHAIAIVKRWGRDNVVTDHGNYYSTQFLKAA